jgi:hypothetical protein
MTRGLVTAVLILAAAPSGASAQDRVLTFSLRPAPAAQIAIWIETDDGAFLGTVMLTAATAIRGIGNRPGASQMNSGYRWPYGRRESVLPVWAYRRLAAPGVVPFPRVVFQDRPEGFASRTRQDSSPDEYFCLRFAREYSRRDGLDAMTCASVFHSDKGRYLAPEDVARGYAEPFEAAGTALMRPLSIGSAYPPRRDLVTTCGGAVCFDSPDPVRYAADAARAMPELDAITRATLAGDVESSVLFSVPDAWPAGDYAAFVEVNVEGDYNETWNDASLPTPLGPSGAWDRYATGYGYPYRGQPSVVYRVPVDLRGSGDATATVPHGYGPIDGIDGAMRPMDATITDDPVTAPGSGADRLGVRATGERVRVRVSVCDRSLAPPGEIVGLTVLPHDDRSRSHQHARVSFVAPASERPIARYELRVARAPIVDEPSLLAGVPGNAASAEDVELRIPTDVPAGETISVELGGLSAETRYHVGVRAVDACNDPGPIVSAEVTTTEIHFTTVSPCFVATAAYGSPMAEEIGVLRRLRDRHLRTNAPGRALVDAYYAIGPAASRAVAASPTLRGIARAVLEPLVALARAAE